MIVGKYINEEGKLVTCDGSNASYRRFYGLYEGNVRVDRPTKTQIGTLNNGPVWLGPKGQLMNKRPQREKDHCLVVGTLGDDGLFVNPQYFGRNM